MPEEQFVFVGGGGKVLFVLSAAASGVQVLRRKEERCAFGVVPP